MEQATIKLGGRVKRTVVTTLDTADQVLGTAHDLAATARTAVGAVGNTIEYINEALVEPLYEAKMEGIQAKSKYQMVLVEESQKLALAAGCTEEEAMEALLKGTMLPILAKPSEPTRLDQLAE